MIGFPKTADGITVDWLTDRLKTNGLLTGGRVTSVSVTGSPNPDRTASTIAIAYSADATGERPATAFYKYNTNGRDRAVPRYCAAVREARFYSEIDSDSAGPVGPACYDVGGDFDKGGVYLLLEDISESHFLVDKADTPSPYGGWAAFETVKADRFVEIATRLATFQARWWDDPRIREPDLSTGTGDMLSTVMTASETFVEQTLTEEWYEGAVDRLTRYGEPDPPAAANLMRQVIEAWPEMYAARMAQSHITLMHVDLHLRNVLFPVQDRVKD